MDNRVVKGSWGGVNFSLHAPVQVALVEEVAVVGTLQQGDYILGGTYRIERLLYQRPRLNLYLGRRVIPSEPALDAAATVVTTVPVPQEEPLVAIRELLLFDLAQDLRELIEAAAFEEFISPVVLGSPRLPSAGDRVRTEGDRHYLVMQLNNPRSIRQASVVTLADLLTHPLWPTWLRKHVPLSWGIQLCRIVARLHRLGVLLGDINPATVLVDRDGTAPWAPVLLVSWPPAPQFWEVVAPQLPVYELYDSVFPIADPLLNNAFVAPELFAGVCDERADVYSLGAILYLLFTRYAPVAASHRLHAHNFEECVKSQAVEVADCLELPAPRQFSELITQDLEEVLLRALALSPDQRYDTVFELVEILETIEFEETRVNLARIQKETAGWKGHWRQLKKHFSTL